MPPTITTRASGLVASTAGNARRKLRKPRRGSRLRLANVTTGSPLRWVTPSCSRRVVLLKASAWGQGDAFVQHVEASPQVRGEGVAGEAGGHDAGVGIGDRREPHQVAAAPLGPQSGGGFAQTGIEAVTEQARGGVELGLGDQHRLGPDVAQVEEFPPAAVGEHGVGSGFWSGVCSGVGSDRCQAWCTRGHTVSGARSSMQA